MVDVRRGNGPWLCVVVVAGGHLEGGVQPRGDEDCQEHDSVPRLADHASDVLALGRGRVYHFWVAACLPVCMTGLAERAELRHGCRCPRSAVSVTMEQRGVTAWRPAAASVWLEWTLLVKGSDVCTPCYLPPRAAAVASSILPRGGVVASLLTDGRPMLMPISGREVDGNVSERRELIMSMNNVRLLGAIAGTAAVSRAGSTDGVSCNAVLLPSIPCHVVARRRAGRQPSGATHTRPW